MRSEAGQQLQSGWSEAAGPQKPSHPLLSQAQALLLVLRDPLTAAIQGMWTLLRDLP